MWIFTFPLFCIYFDEWEFPYLHHSFCLRIFTFVVYFYFWIFPKFSHLRFCYVFLNFFQNFAHLYSFSCNSQFVRIFTFYIFFYFLQIFHPLVVFVFCILSIGSFCFFVFSPNFHIGSFHFICLQVSCNFCNRDIKINAKELFYTPSLSKQQSLTEIRPKGVLTCQNIIIIL